LKRGCFASAAAARVLLACDNLEKHLPIRSADKDAGFQRNLWIRSSAATDRGWKVGFL
jgi:hypothetical protein